MTEPTTLTTLEAAGVLLTADADARVLRYRLLPYGEAGRTSVGMVTASAGVLELPERAEDMHLNIGHDRNRPVGKGVNLEDTELGLVAAFRIARTSSGDDLLAEAAEGLRPGVSVEIADPVIRAGKLVGGRLVHAGAVTEPAFPSAVLVAADAGADPSPARVSVPVPDEAAAAALAHLDDHSDDNPDDQKPDEKPDDEKPDEDQQDADETDADDDTDESETAMTPPASAPADLTASATRATTPVVKTARDLFTLMAQAHASKDPVLMAALADITQTAIGGDIAQHQWLGELWSGKAFTRLIVPLFGHADLTSFKVDGWRWVVKPTVDYWTGDKTAVPSNTPDTEPQSVPAVRIAGAHDIDRIYRDFDVAGFWESYFRALTESYARKSDAKALADAIAAAPAVTPGAVPAGISKGMAAVVDGALAIIDVASPSFAVVGKALYRDLVLTRTDDSLAYLNASLGLEDGTAGSFRIIPSGATALVGKVLVGAREAMTVHELAGSPIRAEALDMVRGGVDTGLFGYMADVVHDDEALALVTTV